MAERRLYTQMEKIRIVTDSIADLPATIVKELGIVVVPANVIFGQKSYKDDVEMTKEDFYQRLREGDIHPTTSAPAPGEFVRVYQELAKEADAIISIHAPKKLSAIYSSAMTAKDIVVEEKADCKIAVIDSSSAAMGIGFLAIMTAKLAKAGKDSDEIVQEIEKNIPHVHLLAVIDNLQYVKKGGRAEAIFQRIGSFIPKSIKVSLTIEEGDVHFAGFVKTTERQKKILKFISGFPAVKEIALEYSPDSEGVAENAIKEMGETVKSLFPGIPLYFSILTPALGAQAGPGVTAVILREGAA